jgi:polysaccharide export outer membrane protein
MKDLIVRTAYLSVLCAAVVSSAAAQQMPASHSLPTGYVIGVEDILTVVFLREKDLSAEVVVRPDGKISLPLLNDLHAAGLTPEQLSDVVEQTARKYIRDAEATVIVKDIRSRKVFVIGEVAKPGGFQLANEMTVLQLIAQAGGFLEYANKGDVIVVRNENGREQRLKFNYNEVVKGKNTEQNMMLRPGDTVLVR